MQGAPLLEEFITGFKGRPKTLRVARVWTTDESEMNSRQALEIFLYFSELIF